MGDRLVTIDMGRKLGVVPLLGGELGPQGPSFVPSGILIHPAVWPQQIWPKIALHVARAEAYLRAKPQYTNVTDRTRQTDRQRSDSVGQTVLQKVAQKLLRAMQIAEGFIIARFQTVTSEFLPFFPNWNGCPLRSILFSVAV